jgi:endonuclease/exonuclease/phosphatase family metal-dependent hydrolase
MTTFLFWNVQNKQLDGYIVRLVQEHQVDVLLLLEHPKPDNTLFTQLNHVRQYQRVTTHNRFGVYVSFDSSQMVRITPPTTTAGDRVDYWDININKKNRLFLVLVHGLDIINYSEQARSLFFERLRNDVVWIEDNDIQVGHKQTVILGDFNANPFEAIVGGISGLHAIRVKEVGGKRNRSISGENYEFFCNPMWSCYKGWEKSPPGTHYFNGGDVHEVFWHMIDQVVLRPQALHMFSEKDLHVLTEAGNNTLLTSRGLPDKGNASDHLPVLFKLNLDV